MPITVRPARRAGDRTVRQVVPDLMSSRKLKTLWGLYLLATLLPAQAQEVYYIHTDALGSPVAETDANRNVVKRYEYEPYGRRLNGSNDDKPGYTGHVMDAVTGLVQMQQRYYDPSIGAMLSVDPVTAYEQPITNFCRYCYANNNPYRFTDPDGRQSVPQMVLPSGITSDTRFPQNEAQAHDYGTAPAVPFNRENFARDMDALSNQATVVEVGAMAFGHAEVAVGAAIVSTTSGVAAFIAEPTLERAIDVGTGGILQMAGKAAKLIDNPTVRDAVTTGSEGVYNGDKIVKAADTVRGEPTPKEEPAKR